MIRIILKKPVTPERTVFKTIDLNSPEIEQALFNEFELVGMERIADYNTAPTEKELLELDRRTFGKETAP